ncbi:MAG: ParB N-terminal domain-containing protein [Kordiimonas sp.]
MLKVVTVKIEDIYVPTAHRKDMDQAEVDTIVDAMLEGEEQKPIRVRHGKGRYVLIDGNHTLEASKAVGEDTINTYIVQSRKF